ncbi:hypothetical protein ABFT80_06135 [Mesorhizobium sp. SB112]|uniref:hypothetical protein n=1 Tax=Mesorhizobium sp. SB112 TaxID=3151853 RepID=UPI003266A8C1
MMETLSALLTPTLATAVAIIAFMQWRTAHHRVMLDLFDRRMEIYDQTMALMREVLHRGDRIPGHEASEFHKTRNKAKFLFGDDVNGELKDWHEALINMSVSREVIDMNAGDRTEHQAKIAESLKKLLRFRDRIPEIFAPYLRMDQKRVLTPLEWLRERNRVRLTYSDKR